MTTDQLKAIENIEEAYTAIAANLELLKAKTPDQSMFKSNLQLLTIELTKDGGTVHKLRQSFEYE